MSLKDQILAAHDLKVEPVNVPEWGVTVHVHTLNADERDGFELSLANDGAVTIKGVRAKLCAWAMRDSEGVRIFGDDEVPSLAAKSGGAVDRVFAVAQRLNRFSQQDQEALVKNSEAGPAAG